MTLFKPIPIAILVWLTFLILIQASENHGVSEKAASVDGNRASKAIPVSTRAYWMRRANAVLSELASPCPFAAFGTVIVNHTRSNGLGEEVCIGVNSNSITGNPTMHGEIAAISNCSAVLTDPSGPYKMSPSEALAALSDLSLYTNAESCPMCASAIRWANFREYIYGTSIDTLTRNGWGQIQILSAEVFKESFALPGKTALFADVLANETDPYFLWQFNAGYPCPAGCSRDGDICQKMHRDEVAGHSEL